MAIGYRLSAIGLRGEVFFDKLTLLFADCRLLTADCHSCRLPKATTLNKKAAAFTPNRCGIFAALCLVYRARARGDQILGEEYYNIFHLMFKGENLV